MQRLRIDERCVGALRPEHARNGLVGVERVPIVGADGHDGAAGQRGHARVARADTGQHGSILQRHAHRRHDGQVALEGNGERVVAALVLVIGPIVVVAPLDGGDDTAIVALGTGVGKRRRKVVGIYLWGREGDAWKDGKGGVRW